MYASDLSFDHCICMCDHYDLVFGERAAVRRLSGTCANLSADLLAFEIPMQSQLRGAENGTFLVLSLRVGRGLSPARLCSGGAEVPGRGASRARWGAPKACRARLLFAGVQHSALELRQDL